MTTATRPTNPVAAFREALGLSRPELARALGVGYARLVDAELGYSVRLPRVLAEALTAHGHDGAVLADAYAAWRRERAQ